MKNELVLKKMEYSELSGITILVNLHFININKTKILIKGIGAIQQFKNGD